MFFILRSTLIALFFFATSFNVFASSHFTTVGKLNSFRWTPPTYTTGFQYDLFYYIPKSVIEHPEIKSKAILFMHGGGQSTLTREGAIKAVKLYTSDFIKIAEDQHLIVVFPSSSGLNWGGHTRVFLREVAKLMRAELPIDPNGIALIGHSMGGMGITRNAFFLGDQFAFIMPIAAGMDPIHMSDLNLHTLFNAPYHHVQGLYDSYSVFVERARMQAEKMRKLETQLGIQSPFKLTLTQTAHNYDLKQLSSLIKFQFTKSTRNLFQSDLYGGFVYANQILTDNNIRYNLTSTPTYFWLEVTEFIPVATAIRSPFEAHIKDNQISIAFKGPHNVKTLRVYLSKKMIPSIESVAISVNGIPVVAHPVLSSGKSDNGFEYDGYVDLAL